MSAIHQSQLYFIIPKTNLHVGAGSATYGVVDNLVQRDVTGLPCIHSSSLKGALREYFEVEKGLKGSDFVDFAFGSEGTGGKYPKGKFYFTEALTLFLVARSDKTPFLRVTSPQVVAEFLERIDLFGIQLDENAKAAFQQLAQCEVPAQQCLVSDPNLHGATVEDHDWEVQLGKFDLPHLPPSLAQYPLGLLPHESFAQLAKELPVIARNQLDNGESKNLWYEEVVPRQSVFYTVIEHPTVLPNGMENVFDAQLDTLVQIGGNASVGYGLSQIEKI